MSLNCFGGRQNAEAIIVCTNLLYLRIDRYRIIGIDILGA